MVENTRKSFLYSALASGVLALTLTGCGDRSYENFEECQLEEMGKLTQKGKDLSDAALGVIGEFCAKYPLRSEQDAKKTLKSYKDPDWKIVGRKNGYSDGTKFYVDINSIESEGFQKNFWLMMLNKDQKLEGKDFNLYKNQANCSSGTLVTQTEQVWVNNKRVSERTLSSTGEVTPGTAGADIYQYVCEKK